MGIEGEDFYVQTLLAITNWDELKASIHGICDVHIVYLGVALCGSRLSIYLTLVKDLTGHLEAK